MQRPLTSLSPAMRQAADLLAIGVSVEKAAELSGLTVSHIRVLMRGSLFGLAIDRSRDKVLQRHREEFSKALSDELQNNLKALTDIRDNAEKDSDRLHAIDTMLSYIAVPAAKRGGTADAEVKVVIQGDKARQVEDVLTEAIDVTPREKD